MAVIQHFGGKKMQDNDTKEQLYLMPGTPEYEERQEDLKMHDPFKPDDDWHNEREQVNQSHTREMKKKQDEDKEDAPTGYSHYQHRMAKEEQFSDVKKTATSMALATETKEDDKAAEHINRRGLEDLVIDEGVTEDEYVPKALAKYMD